MDRYIVCGRVTKRPIFEFISPVIHPNDSLTAFPLNDDYSFGILQSDIHWKWFVARCSTLKSDPRYTSNTVFDSFPWPQSPPLAAIQKIAKASVELRYVRNDLKRQHDMSLRELYRTLELPGKSALKDAHSKLDEAVRAAYGIAKSDDALEFILNLNKAVVAKEESGNAVTGPGLPAIIGEKAKFVTSDCITMPDVESMLAANSSVVSLKVSFFRA